MDELQKEKDIEDARVEAEAQIKAEQIAFINAEKDALKRKNSKGKKKVRDVMGMNSPKKFKQLKSMKSSD